MDYLSQSKHIVLSHTKNINPTNDDYGSVRLRRMEATVTMRWRQSRHGGREVECIKSVGK